MFEYELMRLRSEELQRQARRDRLVREALAAGGTGSRPGLLWRRLSLPRRAVTAAAHRPARLSEC